MLFIKTSNPIALATKVPIPNETGSLDVIRFAAGVEFDCIILIGGYLGWREWGRLSPPGGPFECRSVRVLPRLLL